VNVPPSFAQALDDSLRLVAAFNGACRFEKGLLLVAEAERLGDEVGSDGARLDALIEALLLLAWYTALELGEQTGEPPWNLLERIGTEIEGRAAELLDDG
jgi:hypothetical protein